MRFTDVIKETSGKKRESKKVSFSNIEEKEPSENSDKRFDTSLKLYGKAVEEVKGVARAVLDGENFTVDKLEKIAGEFADNLLSDYHLFLHALYEEGKDWDLPTHSVNVAIISFKIGQGLRYDDETLKELLLNAFLHDLGMLFVPKALLHKPERLTPLEYEEIKKHSTKTYDILKSQGERFEDLAQVARQEHEREDGSGYPLGLKGDEIDEFAKVIGLADIYAAMIHPRPHRKRILPFDAVKQIIAVNKEGFDQAILKAMINELSAFPHGIYVKFNTNEIGRVVATDRLSPLRPTVEVLYGTDGRPIKEPREVDLRRHHLINIKEAFYKEEVE